MDKFDFSGWATKANLKCSDGRTILKDAFKDNDGKTVPLCWGHSHDPDRVIGHALLENRDEGVYAYCKLNDTEAGQTAKLLVQHGDVNALSIYANQLKQNLSTVLHGNIREVSLVIAGANPGAFIDTVIAHGDDSDEEAIIFTGEEISLYHSDDPEQKGSTKMEDNREKNTNGSENDEETVADVFETLSDKQKKAVYAIVTAALEDDDSDDDSDDEEGGKDNMKHNVFDNDDARKGNVLTHADQEAIVSMAKSSQVGSFQTALDMFAEDNELEHDALASGFNQSGSGNVTELFPEYKDVRPGAPELITNDQGWISRVMSKVHKSPISRIRTRYVDIRKINELRAHGYQKGKEKKQAGNFKLVSRTTDPQTVYVKSALHRDDIIDITDFDYISYLYNIDRMNLNEELATAIMVGDGRDVGAEDKISEDKIRPIWTDDDLYTMHVDLDIAGAKKELQGTGTSVNFGDNYVYAEAMVNTVLYSREKFKGSGTPDFYCTPHLLNQMLLARDMNGRRIYS